MVNEGVSVLLGESDGTSEGEVLDGILVCEGVGALVDEGVGALIIWIVSWEDKTKFGYLPSHSCAFDLYAAGKNLVIHDYVVACGKM